ncbi:mandelate racemase/muconate lactonizing enzyme family protein [Bradyrhizobium australafricanum]|uniref:mandelate racemase/muconate lactonizing enzyme family protein n=1 Tax=Bradyrhizobium australafricanum TaxID=2821406 RepID=UPI001CE29810|nr:mandelate racemase/muconate lactonizing enzyme family protein [Bradyrhizobium australafricanum]MCA6104106.1 mandelate racemase/muconate lactonizing enzyme family protein [Bradyrhizobium australafricanum]
MSISLARVEAFLFRAEVKEPVKTSFGSIPRRSVLLLRVEDTDGAHGWGEVWCNFPPFSADNKMRLLETVICPAALSSTYLDPADAWHTLTARTHRWALQGAEPGPFAACLGGLDLALWDLTARRENKTLRALLNTQQALDAVPAYASGLNPDTAPETVARCREGGFRAYKVKVAFGADKDTRVVSSLAKDLRAGERLMVDANQGWDLVEARRMVPRLGAFGLGWIEEPIAADRPLSEWAELALLSPVALAGGENVMGYEGFSGLIGDGYHGVVQPDMLKWGGVTGAYAVGRRAVMAGRSYCPHWLGSGVGLLAAAQVLAAVGGPGMLEHDVMENPLREALGQPFPRVTNGAFPLPDGPGLGVEPDLQRSEEWLVTRAEYRAPKR